MIAVVPPQARGFSSGIHHRIVTRDPPPPASSSLSSLWMLASLLLSLPTGNCVFCLPPEGGEDSGPHTQSAGLPPVAGPRRHLPPQRQSRRGSSATTTMSFGWLLCVSSSVGTVCGHGVYFFSSLEHRQKQWLIVLPQRSAAAESSQKYPPHC